MTDVPVSVPKPSWDQKMFSLSFTSVSSRSSLTSPLITTVIYRTLKWMYHAKLLLVKLVFDLYIFIFFSLKCPLLAGVLTIVKLKLKLLFCSCQHSNKTVVL